MNCGVCNKKVKSLEDGLKHATKVHGVTKKQADADRKLHKNLNKKKG